MSRILNTAKVLRRNWKKSTFFFGVLAYGGSYFNDKYQTHQMMRAYCAEAKKYGEQPLTQLMKPKHVTVILNPKANYEKSNVQYEKFAAPLLHLAGFKVSVFQTEKEKQAQELMQVMSNTDAVIVAGGNGTLQEAVTGLLLRPNPEEDRLPLGIVPLGKTNTVAEHLFGAKSSSRAQLMAEAVMAVIRETTVKLDVLKVQYLDEDKPVFAMCNFEQGILADVDLLVQKYWYLGSLKERFTYFINSLKEWHPIENQQLEYVAPCSGCSKCFVATRQKENVELAKRWWHVFVPRTVDSKVAASDNAAQDFSRTVNDECGKQIALTPEYSVISVSTAAANPDRTEKSGSLSIKLFPKNLSMKQFISTGLSHRQCKRQDPTGLAQVVDARELVIGVDSAHPQAAAESNTTTTPQENAATFDIASPSVSNSVQSSGLEEPSRSDNLESSGLDNLQSSSLNNLESSSSDNFESSSSDNLESSRLDNLESSSLDNTQSSSLSNGQLTNLGDTESTPLKTIESSSLDSTELSGSTSDGVESSSIESEGLSPEKVDASQSAAPLDSVQQQPEAPPVHSEDKDQFSYIDLEKYRRASCKISILPKQVTVFG